MLCLYCLSQDNLYLLFDSNQAFPSAGIGNGAGDPLAIGGGGGGQNPDELDDKTVDPLFGFVVGIGGGGGGGQLPGTVRCCGIIGGGAGAVQALTAFGIGGGGGGGFGGAAQ